MTPPASGFVGASATSFGLFLAHIFDVSGEPELSDGNINGFPITEIRGVQKTLFDIAPRFGAYVQRLLFQWTFSGSIPLPVSVPLPASGAGMRICDSPPPYPFS